MRGIRDLWGQLVERRLWPVALVLVVALVAVPFVLAKPAPSGDDAASAPGDAPVAAAAAAADLRTPGEPVVSIAGDVEGTRLRGHAKNPFVQQHVPKAASAGEGGSGAVETVPPVESGGDGGSGDSGGADDTPPPESFTYAAIDVRFGRAGSPLREIRNVPRLTPLPNAATPIVIFLGMRGDHETALFMVSTDVHAQGDGRCVPSPKVCEAIELKQDDVAFLDVRAEDGTVTQYELDLVHVELRTTTSKQEASQSYARPSDLRDRSAQADGARATRRFPPQASAGTAPALTPLP